MYPNVNLQPGQRGPEVEKLQNFLMSQGLLTKEQIKTGPGIYGPQTKQAVTYWQEINGVDNTSGPGYWGPQSIGVASGDVSGPTSATGGPFDYLRDKNHPFYSPSKPITPATPATPAPPAPPTPVQPTQYAGGLPPDDPSNQYNTQTGQMNPLFGSGSGNIPVDGGQPYSDEEYEEALNNNPIIAESVAKGNTAADLAYAAETGDYSGLVNQFGQPFSLEDQQKALADATEDNRLYYEALQSKETADAEGALAQQKADYQDYLLTSGQQFEADKAQSDQTAKDRGVLFSGGRVQKERNLERAYRQDEASTLASTARGIGDTARDFQYKYGNEEANKLRSNYNLGGNTFNASTARGGVGSSGLSSIYNPSQYNYQGTRKVERKTAANKRAAGYLWNKGNKLLASGYSNKY